MPKSIKVYLALCAIVGTLCVAGMFGAFEPDPAPTPRTLLPAPGGSRTVPTCGLSVPGAAWTRHVINQNTLRGSDGVILADFNGDGRSEIVSPWEQSGFTTISIHPGNATVRSVGSWTTASIVTNSANEGACVADFDMDGRLDIASTSQGGTAAIMAFGPALNADLATPAAWELVTHTVTGGLGIPWMTCTGTDCNDDGHLDLLLGGETGGATGQLACLRAPTSSKRTAWATLTNIITSGRIMSLWSIDIGATTTALTAATPDGDDDIFASTRQTPGTGTFWLEQTAPGVFATRTISSSLAWHGNTDIFMLFEPRDWNDDGDRDVCGCSSATTIRCYDNSDGTYLNWRPTMIPYPAQFGNCTGVAPMGDLNLDLIPDIVVASFDAANTTQSGLVWLDGKRSATGVRWVRGEIEGLSHTQISKWDMVALYDVDGDGDLDVIAGNSGDEDLVVEANEGLFWFENPCK